MSDYRVEVPPSVERALAALPRSVRERIAAKITALATDPRPRGTKALKGRSPLLRLRVGAHRVVFAVDDASRTVRLTRVASRAEAYRRL